MNITMENYNIHEMLDLVNSVLVDEAFCLKKQLFGYKLYYLRTGRKSFRHKVISGKSVLITTFLAGVYFGSVINYEKHNENYTSYRR